MTNVLVVKANNRPADQAVSSKMYEVFTNELQGKEGVNVSTFDVFAEDMPYFGQDLFDAFANLQAGKELEGVQARIVAAQTKAREAVNNADVVVFAFPLWNWTIPAPLQTFIDYTCGAGYSFKYNEQGQLVSLLADKKTVFLTARGGYYSAPEMQPMEHSLNYMRQVVADTFGMEVLAEVVIEGHNANRAEAESIFATGYEAVKAAANKVASLVEA